MRELARRYDEAAGCLPRCDYAVEFANGRDTDPLRAPLLTLNEKPLVTSHQHEVNSAVTAASPGLGYLISAPAERLTHQTLKLGP
jgi:hypothetical protein